MSDLLFYTPILVFMLTLMFIALTISGMLKVEVLIVDIDSIASLTKSVKMVYCHYVDHGEIVDLEFSTYKKVPRRKSVPVLKEYEDGYDLLHRGTLCLGIGVGIILCLCEMLLGIWVPEYSVLFTVCGLLSASCMLLLLYTVAVKYKHARLSQGLTERSARQEVFRYHDRSYYHSRWFKLLQVVLLGLLIGAFDLLYYDPSFKANTEAMHAITGVECSELVPKAVKYSILSEYYTDPDVLSNTVYCNDSGDLEMLLERMVSANIYQQLLSDALWQDLLAILYIALYILVLFPMNYLLYLFALARLRLRYPK